MSMALNEGTMKFGYYLVGVILLIQNIYFYDNRFGWTIIPIFVLYALIIDICKNDVRSYKTELLSLLLFVIFSLSIIFIDHSSNIFTVIVSIELLAIIIFCFQLVVRVFFLFKNKEPHFFINSRNTKLIEKKTRFMPIFLACTGISLVFAAARVLLGL